MPGGKRRLKQLLTTGIQVGPDTDAVFFTEILAGSVNVTAPSFAGNTPGSADTANATISGLTAAHYFIAQPKAGISACTALLSASAGAGSAIFNFGYIAGSGGAKADEATVTMDYIAFTLG